MKGPCVLVPYIMPSGQSHVVDFLDALREGDRDAYAKFWYAQSLLVEHGTDIGSPHWKWLGDGLGEIRWRSGTSRFRIYSSEEAHHTIVMYEALVKKWGPFLPHHRKVCLERQKDYRSAEYDQESRKYLYFAKRKANARP